MPDKQDLDPSQFTDRELRDIVGGRLLLSEALAIEERHGTEALDRVTAASGTRGGRPLSAAFTGTIIPGWRGPEQMKAFSRSPAITALMESLSKQAEATQILTGLARYAGGVEATVKPRPMPEPIQIAPRPEIGLLRDLNLLLQGLVDHQRTASQAAERTTQFQIEEAIESRRQARRTHKVTRAATAAGILAGPLALYVATVDPVPTGWAIALCVLWVVAPLTAYVCDRPDPILDAVDRPAGQPGHRD